MKKKTNNNNDEKCNRNLVNLAAASYLSDQEEGDLYDAYEKLLELSNDGKGDDLPMNHDIEIWEPLMYKSIDYIIKLIDDNASVILNNDSYVEKSQAKCYESGEVVIPNLFKNIDWKLLRKQKRLMDDIITWDSIRETLCEEHIDAIVGVMCLIDAIQDDAVDKYGYRLKKVFGKKFAKEFINDIKEVKEDNDIKEA